MLSILIPTYNYNIFSLVERLQKEAQGLSVKYEILALDDGSPNFETISSNDEIRNLLNCHFFRNKRNIGRTATRQRLAETAMYKNLLFLDADVFPKKVKFLEIYLRELTNSNAAVIFGGIEYESHKPDKNKMLRWKYGVARESLSVKKRKKNPFLTINSGAFLIKKDLFLKINNRMNINNYGMDIMFTQLLKEETSEVVHIHNPVVHLGLEENGSFLKKSLMAVGTVAFLEDNSNISNNLSSLQRSYLKLKKLHLTSVFSFIISKMKNKMEQNFLSETPNLFWFDLYRLHHYIQLKENKNA